MKDYALFIGASAMPNYAIHNPNGKYFKDEIINKIFIEFRKELKSRVIGNNIDEKLYIPLHYYTIGHFHLLSICLVDDFHFANFSYHPYSVYAQTNNENESIDKRSIRNNHLLFEYQVTNGVDILTTSNETTLISFNHWHFIAMSKIKINSSLIFEIGFIIIANIKDYIIHKYIRREDFKIIISESVSWHELTILTFSNSISLIIEIIREIREFTYDDYCLSMDIKSGDKPETKRNLISDTHTTYGIHPDLHDISSDRFREYEKLGSDSDIVMMSRVHVKSGHEKKLLSLIKAEFSQEIDLKSIKSMDGRTDFILNYQAHSVVNYIKYWNKIGDLQKKTFDSGNILKQTILSHIKTWHSNLTKNEDIFDIDVDDLDISASTILIESLKISNDIILNVSKNLQKLNVSKDLRGIVVSLFTNFNEIICDSTLYQYFVDVKPLLVGLSHYLDILVDETNDNYKYQRLKEYRSSGNLTKVLYSFVNLWQLAYQNRFQESKRFGYNSDSKAEFNGGAHQIIHTYDSLYKLVVKTFKIPSEVHDILFVPLATYGSNRSGIASTINYLHLNYFQLFHPEFFLFALPKESINQQFDRFYVGEFELNGDVIKPIESIKRIRIILANYISDEPNPIMKRILYEFCPPEKIIESVNYILSYTSFFEIGYTENKELFVFWFWQNYLQESENYNVDGTLKISQLKRVLFLFIFSQAHLGYQYTIDEFIKIVKAKVLGEYLRSPFSDYFEESLFNVCLRVVCNIEKSIHDEYYPLLEAMSKITFNLTNESTSNYLRLTEISIGYLKWLMDNIVESGENATYSRNNFTGMGIPSDEYCRAVFDPHGGLFTLDPILRREHLKMRVRVMKKLGELSMAEKQILFKELKLWETSQQVLLNS